MKANTQEMSNRPPRGLLSRERKKMAVLSWREPQLHEHILVVRTPDTMPTAARRRQHITIQPESHAAAAPKFSRLASAAKAKAFLSA
mmetsp:Transcript_56456/g.183428  ORF Transcript_56456/g.183428 Transcript_56456/m.183428 type:complete len:87 (-) Transcript_56456:1456-1716(-)